MFKKNFSLILLISMFLLWAKVENKSIFGIGTRIYGDQLLLKDVLVSRLAATDENPTIHFNYAIPEPITYVEMAAEENIYANVSFSNSDDLVIGTVTALQSAPSNTSLSTAVRLPKSFEILITIYGLNETMLNLNTAYILNRDEVFAGLLKPYVEEPSALRPMAEKLGTNEQQESEEDDGNGSLDDDDLHFGEGDIDNGDQNNTANDEEIVRIGEGVEVEVFGDLDAEYQHMDKIIEIGHRQPGDHLIYETYQTSKHSTPAAANHSVIFYYIDNDFITYVKFILFEHYVDNKIDSTNYMAPLVEYTHYSPVTLKASITDYNTTSLFVQMFIYGYNPAELPRSYVPYLPSSNWNQMPDAITDTPLANRTKQRLMHLLKAQVMDADDDNDFQQQSNDMESELVKLTGTTTDFNTLFSEMGYHDEENYDVDEGDSDVEQVQLSPRSGAAYKTNDAINIISTWIVYIMSLILLYHI